LTNFFLFQWGVSVLYCTVSIFFAKVKVRHKETSTEFQKDLSGVLAVKKYQRNMTAHEYAAIVKSFLMLCQQVALSVLEFTNWKRKLFSLLRVPWHSLLSVSKCGLTRHLSFLCFLSLLGSPAALFTWASLGLWSSYLCLLCSWNYSCVLSCLVYFKSS
jgi:hypothetical protein